MIATAPQATTVLELYGDLWGRARDEEFSEVIGESLQPRGPEMLFDLFSELGVKRGEFVIDVGGRDAVYSVDLARRFDVRVLMIDPVPHHLELAADRITAAQIGNRVTVDLASIESLPLGNGTADHIWCRDVLNRVDLATGLAECARVLRPGGGMLVYQTFATAEMEPREHAGSTTRSRSTAKACRTTRSKALQSSPVSGSRAGTRSVANGASSGRRAATPRRSRISSAICQNPALAGFARPPLRFPQRRRDRGWLPLGHLSAARQARPDGLFAPQATGELTPRRTGTSSWQLVISSSCFVVRFSFAVTSAFDISTRLQRRASGWPRAGRYDECGKRFRGPPKTSEQAFARIDRDLTLWPGWCRFFPQGCIRWRFSRRSAASSNGTSVAEPGT